MRSRAGQENLAILGDMLELGRGRYCAARIRHRERWVAVADVLIAVEAGMVSSWRAGLEGRDAKSRSARLLHVDEAIELVKDCHRTGDRLLVKDHVACSSTVWCRNSLAGPDSAKRRLTDAVSFALSIAYGFSVSYVFRYITFRTILRDHYCVDDPFMLGPWLIATLGNACKSARQLCLSESHFVAGH